MSGKLHHNLSSASFSAILAAMARPRDLRSLSLGGLHLVMAIRLCAVFEAAGRDPIPDLASRYRSIEAACAVDGLVRTIKTIWPEPFVVNRPCMRVITPDEATLAALARTALAGQREAFCAEIDGFVRADRHETLYAATVHAGALIR